MFKLIIPVYFIILTYFYLNDELLKFKILFANLNWYSSLISYPVYHYYNPNFYSFFYLYSANLFFYMVYLFYSFKYLNDFYFLMFLLPPLYLIFKPLIILELVVLYNFHVIKNDILEFMYEDDGSYRKMIECVLLITTLMHFPSRLSFFINYEKMMKIKF